MSLSTDDLTAIGDLMDRKLDQKLAQVQAKDRRRRRFWLWFTVVVFVLSSVASWFVAQHYVRLIQDEMTKVDNDLRQAKLAYQAELARNATLQAERKVASEASGYVSDQDQASYEAGLISSMFRIVASSRALNESMANLDPDDPEALMRATEQMAQTTQDAIGTFGQIMLRNTDPAHNTPEENLLLGETPLSTEPADKTVVVPEPTPTP